MKTESAIITYAVMAFGNAESGGTIEVHKIKDHYMTGVRRYKFTDEMWGRILRADNRSRRSILKRLYGC